jgi:RND family efflux transporter MFP subunit
MYRSTMNPNEISDKPGKDSMGMEMVPFEVEEAGPSAVGGRAVVKISPERQQLIGVRTATLKVQPIHRLIRAVGRVEYAEPNISLVTLKFEGWIERLFVNSTGRLVRRGEALFEIYSPDLVSAQQEYLLALKAKEITGSSGLSVLGSAREKLKLWGITDQQVENLERTGEIKRTLTIYAPSSGFVIEKGVLLGQKIMPGENLYKIADLSTVWVLGDVYEYELPLVKKGQGAMISLSYFPGETFSGKITYIYPYLNPETRTNRVRIEVKNPGFKLKPEMYANLEIHVEYGTKLAIPVDAVLDAGVKNVVFVDKGDGYFEPREVKLGAKGEGVYEVLAGVAEGEKVVTSANFLVDSESSLKAALQQMTQGESGAGKEEPKHD